MKSFVVVYHLEMNDQTMLMNEYQLRAQYRLTLLNAIKMKSKRCFLTLLGTGAFHYPVELAMQCIEANKDIINSGMIEVFLVQK